MPRTKPPNHRSTPEIWEVAVVPSPAQVDDGPVFGIGLAIDTASGQIRWASPVASLLDIVPGLAKITLKAGKPAEILYDEPDLDAAMESLSAEIATPTRRAPCPTLQRAERSLLAAMAGGMPAAGMPLRIASWRRITSQLRDLAPWRRLGERVWFKFRGAGLDGAVAVLIGELDEAWGMTLYPNEEALVAFITAVSHGDPQSAMETPTLSLQIEDLSEATPSDVALCRSLDLVFDGRIPRLLALGDGAVRAPTRAEQRLLLAAVEGVTTLCANEIEALEGDGAARMQMIVTGGGRLEIEAVAADISKLDIGEEEPTDDLPAIIEAEHAVLFGSMTVGSEGRAHPSVVVKLRKRDALKLAERCAQIASLALYRQGTRLQLVACDKRGARATLVKLWGSDLDEIGTHLVSQGELYLAISSGGPTRSRIRAADFVYAKVLPVVALVS